MDTQPPADTQPPPAVLGCMPYLMAVVENDGSDLHMKAGSPPRIRINGRLRPLRVPELTAEDCERLVLETMDEITREKFGRLNEADYAVSVSGVGRFRANAFRQRGSAGAVLRLVGDRPMTFAELGLSDVIGQLALKPRGLVLVTGPTGSGKTTTLAAMVDHINKSRECHILTLEDPIEVMHRDQLSMVNQRELNTDTSDFPTAMRAAMRQDPDVILIGEMRDAETVKAALSAAETGHFVMSTLHTTDAAETVNRIIDFFPPHEQKQVRLSLAGSMQGIICQRLVPKPDGKGRVACMEIMIASGRIAEAIADPEKTSEIQELVATGGFYGMQTFDQHLLKLVVEGEITMDAARLAATNPHDLEVHLKRTGLVLAPSGKGAA